ncbi:hypothetical protein HN587_06115 [Candidatus Woesearchaeota archaeon]|jgi:hypothetical protein|nr:hypothetical protein [Candidatus Woesearchaeota archaeon]
MRRLAIILVILMMIFLVGCGENQDSAAQPTGIKTGSMFIQGTDGLSIEFVSGAPPTSVVDKEQPFGISVRIENLGGHDIDLGSDATVTVTGFDPADFGVGASDLKKDSPDPLRGVKIDTEGGKIPGGMASIDFPTSGSAFVNQKEVAGQVTYNIKADVCYNYGTVVNSELCILEDMLGMTGQESSFCKVTEEKSVDNSGAPVQVTSFRESVGSATKTNFIFKVEHKGSGKLYASSSECVEEFPKRNKVHVEIDTGISGGLTCSGLQDPSSSGSVYSGDVVLLNGMREISCSQEISSPSDFKKVVRIDLGYDYKQSAETSLTVQHIGG